MGITASDITLIEKSLQIKPDIKGVIELGSQNLYLDNDPKPPFASTWYEQRGIHYHCIDMAGDNGAIKRDLSTVLRLVNQPGSPVKADLVTDFGTSEHVVHVPVYQSVAFHEGHINSVYPTEQPNEEQISKGFYNCWVNKHDLLAVGGLMINVNPKTGNWPGHCYTYLTSRFYIKLTALMGYNIHHLEDHPAMGNTISGWNVCCILEKTEDREFISFEEFQQCEQLRK